MTKNIEKLRYFFGVEVVYQKKGLRLSHRKYKLDLLQETGILGFKHVSTPME